MDARDARLQRGVDSFFRSMIDPYRTPTGAVTVSAPFFMVPGWSTQQATLRDPGRHAALLKVAVSAGLSAGDLAVVQMGRGSSAQIHGLTQALLDQQPPDTVWGDPSSKVWQARHVRQLMWEHAIGIDCAGYVQQAYLRATGRTRDQAGFRPRVQDDDLSGLSGRGYLRFDTLADVRPGDIISFFPPTQKKGEVGHRTIVFDQRVARADDQGLGWDRFAAGGTVRVLLMDSSYGAGGQSDHGGVQRETWLFNEANDPSRRWALLRFSRDPDTLQERPGSGVVQEMSQLYLDPFDGYYRRKGD